jgi:type IV pilus assembly protein PilE
MRGMGLDNSGFSLLELLVTMAIVAILSAIAWPGYGAVVRRAQRDEARLALLGLQYAEELRYQNSLSYSDDIEAATTSGGLGLTAHTASGSYRLEVELLDSGQRYRARARPVASGPQSADRSCALLVIDEAGRRSASDADGRDTSSTCWR